MCAAPVGKTSRGLDVDSPGSRGIAQHGVGRAHGRRVQDHVGLGHRKCLRDGRGVSQLDRQEFDAMRSPVASRLQAKTACWPHRASSSSRYEPSCPLAPVTTIRMIDTLPHRDRRWSRENFRKLRQMPSRS